MEEKLLRGMPCPLNKKGTSGLGLEGMCQLIDQNLEKNEGVYVILHAGANDSKKLKEKSLAGRMGIHPLVPWGQIPRLQATMV